MPHGMHMMLLQISIRSSFAVRLRDFISEEDDVEYRHAQAGQCAVPTGQFNRAPGGAGVVACHLPASVLTTTGAWLVGG